MVRGNFSSRSLFARKLREVQYDVRIINHLQLPNVKTAKYGIENIQYIGHHLWASIQEEIKDSDPLNNFKKKINHEKEVLASADYAKFSLMDQAFSSFFLLLKKTLL